MDAQPQSPRPQSLVSPSQLVAIGLVAASIGWAMWLMRDRPRHEEVELLSGSVLPSSELAIMEAAFDRAQLTDYRTEGGRVWVPRARQSAYMRALVDAEALPREFGGSLRRALENNSPWQSKAVQSSPACRAGRRPSLHRRRRARQPARCPASSRSRGPVRLAWPREGPAAPPAAPVAAVAAPVRQPSPPAEAAAGQAAAPDVTA